MDDRPGSVNAGIDASWRPGRQSDAMVVRCALIVRILGACLGYGLTIVLARQLGSEVGGTLFAALAVASGIQQVGLWGLDIAALRRLVGRTPARFQLLSRSVLGTGLLTALAASLFVVTGIGLLSAAGVSHWGALGGAVIALVPLGIAGVQNLLLGEIVKARGRVCQSQVIQACVVPALSLAAVIAIRPTTLYGACGALVGGVAAGYTVAVSTASRAVGRVLSPHFRGFPRRLLKEGQGYWMVSVLNYVATSAVVPIAALRASPGAAGELAIAARTAAGLALILVAVNALAVPRIATAVRANGGVGPALRLVHWTGRTAFAYAAPSALILGLTAPIWIRIFGGDFAGAVSPTRILLAGQVVATATGASGYSLMLAGQVRSLQVYTAVAGAVAVLGAWIAGPHFGAAGCAWAMTGAVGIMNILAYVRVYVLARRTRA